MPPVFLLFDIEKTVGILGVACFSVGAPLLGHSLAQEKKGAVQKLT
jgi:hypothetical protein